MVENCDRCGGDIDQLGRDGEPVVIGFKRTTTKVPARGEPSDPAFVQRFEPVTYEEPQTAVVCNDCRESSDTPIREVAAGAFSRRPVRGRHAY